MFFSLLLYFYDNPVGNQLGPRDDGGQTMRFDDVLGQLSTHHHRTLSKQIAQ
jgi:hypothetical protein